MSNSPTEMGGDGRGPDGAFLDDTGALPIDTRRVLVQLLLGPSLDARRQSKLRPVLLRDEAVVRSRLHELFLEVVIDHEQRIAFTRQMASEGFDVPVLLRKASADFSRNRAAALPAPAPHAGGRAGRACSRGAWLTCASICKCSSATATPTVHASSARR